MIDKREWNNCFIKNNQEILLDLADFTLHQQAEDNLMVAISRAWYNGSYAMATNPIKSLELHYTMIQFSNNSLYIRALHHTEEITIIKSSSALTCKIKIRSSTVSWLILIIRDCYSQLAATRPFDYLSSHIQYDRQVSSISSLFS